MDLLLDRSPVAAAKAAPVYVDANGGAGQERVTRVQRVLQLLDAMPAAEPPKDLLARTLKFIDTAEETGRTTGRANRPMLPASITMQPPVA